MTKMIFETELDDAGKVSIKQFSAAFEKYNVIKPDCFKKLSPSQEKDLVIISHFFKKNLHSNLLNCDNQLKIMKSEEFDSIDFKKLFQELFDSVFDSFKDIFFINEKRELVNRYEGSVLKIDNTTQNIHFEKLPGYELLWGQVEEKLKNRSSSSDNFDLSEYINVRFLNTSGIDIKRQFLNYIGEVFKTDEYSINQPIVVEKMFNYLNKDGYLNIDNLSDFKKEIEFINERYYKNEYLNVSNPEYILHDKELSILNDCNLFDFFDKRMSDLFCDISIPFSLISYSNRTLILSDSTIFKHPVLDEVISPEYVDEINKVVNVFSDICNRFYEEYSLYSTGVSRKYLYSDEKNIKAYNFSYNEFLDYYKLNDDTMSLCFFYYMFEFSLFDKKIEDYINKIIFDFTKNNEKAYCILLKENALPITVADFNKIIDFPLHVLNSIFSKESKDLFKFFISIYKSNCKFPIEYDNNTADDMQKLLCYATSHNKNNVLCEKLGYSDYFKSSKNIINFIGYIKEIFKQKGEVFSSKIESGGCISRRLKKEKDYSEIIKDRMKWTLSKNDVKIEKNMEEDEWLDFVGDKLFELLTGDGLIVSQEEIINNIRWIEKEFKLDNKKVICSLRRIPSFNKDRNWRPVAVYFDEMMQLINLLDYHLLKGHDEVVYYLKSKGFHPQREENITSLDYAIIGGCNNDIIDWICEENKVESLDKINVFGFVRSPIYPSSVNKHRIYETLIRDFKIKSYFNYSVLEALSTNKNVNLKLDSIILEKINYVYKKYKVDFKNNAERIYYLLNKENECFFRDNLNMDSDYLEKIKYSLLIKDMVMNQEIDLLKKEIKSSRLTIDMNLMHDIITKDDKQSSGILNLLHLSLENSKDRKDIDFTYKLTTSILENMDEKTRNNIFNIKCFEGLNIFEIILSHGVHKHHRLIKKLVIDYSFNLNSGLFIFSNFKRKEIFKTYNEHYFSSNVYFKNLYIYFSTQFEKEKIAKVINSVEIKKVNRKRM